MAGRRKGLGVLLVLTGLLTTALIVGGCTGPRQPQNDSTNNHYGAKGISFDYPKSWVISSSSSRYALVTITDPNAERTSIFVERRVMPAGYTLETIDDELVSEWAPTAIVSEESTTVAGLPAIKTRFNSMQGIPVRDYTTGLVCFEKAGQVYSIILSTPSEVYDAALPAFDMVLTTFAAQ